MSSSDIARADVRGIVVEMDGRAHRVDSPERLDELLSPRILAAAGGAGADDGIDAAADARRVQRYLAQLVGGRRSSDEVYAELGSAFFTEHLGWRTIVAHIAGLGPECEELKLLALARYRRYLLARAGAPDAGPAPARGGMPPEMVRLPSGRPVELAVSGPIDLWMGERCFRLHPEDAGALEDDAGRRTPLRVGSNLVGRALYADVVIDEGYADVSRRHLVIEALAGNRVVLTDTSSRGTFVPRDTL